MTHLMVDPTTANHLRNLKSPIVLCDESGHVLGRMIPPSQYDSIAVPFSEADLQIAESDPTEFALTDILSDLERR